MPNQGKCPERRYVLLSIEKSPVTNRQRLNCRSHASNNIAASSTIPKARAGAVYSPDPDGYQKFVAEKEQEFRALAKQTLAAK